MPTLTLLYVNSLIEYIYCAHILCNINVPSVTVSLQLWKFKYFSAGLLSSRDNYPDHVRKLEEKSSIGEDGEKLIEANAGLDAKVRLSGTHW